MRISDDRYRRDQTAFASALRFIGYGVRTATIHRWTGITPSRIRSLYKTYARDQGIKRPRGHPPTVADYLVSRPQQRQEAVAWAFICQRMHVLPQKKVRSPEKTLPGVGRAELLLNAFEMFKCDFPIAALTLDQAVLLLMAFARREELRLGRCRSCGGITLIDHSQHTQITCVFCLAGIEETKPPLHPPDLCGPAYELQRKSADSCC